MQESYLIYWAHKVNQKAHCASEKIQLYAKEQFKAIATISVTIWKEGYSIPLSLLFEMAVGIFLLNTYAGWLGVKAEAEYSFGLWLIEFTVVPLLSLQITAASVIDKMDLQAARRREVFLSNCFPPIINNRQGLT